MPVIQSLQLRLAELWEHFRQAWKSVLGDSGAILFFFIVPILYPFLYASLYGREGIQEAPLVVVDKSQSVHSREFIRRVDASPDVAVVAQVGSESAAYPLVTSEKAYAILVIPEHFEERLQQGKQAEVNLHATYSSALYYKAYSLTTTEVALAMGREIEGARHPAGSEEATRIAVRPIESEWLVPYNPQSGFQGFLLPGILVLIFQQTLLLGIAMLRATERERALAQPRGSAGGRARGSALSQLLGQVLCYLTIYTVMSAFTLVLAPRLLGLPQLTQLTTYLMVLLPLLLSCIAFSCFWARFFPSRESTMLLGVWTSLPFLFLSGLSWPVTAIPAPLQALGYLVPSTPGVQAFVAVNSMGASVAEVQAPILTLWIQAFVYFALSVLLDRYALLRKESTLGKP